MRVVVEAVLRVTYDDASSKEEAEDATSAMFEEAASQGLFTATIGSNSKMTVDEWKVEVSSKKVY